MSKLKALTANRLSDGTVVWLGADGTWQERLNDAFVARHEAALAGLESALKIAAFDKEVVDVEIIEVEERGGQVHPQRLRERIRASGPSVRTDLGKQAETANDDIVIAA